MTPARRGLAWASAALAATVLLIIADSADAIARGWRALLHARDSNIGDPWPTVVAAARLATTPHAALYADFTPLGSSFIYPPLAALVCAPLAHADYAQAQVGLSLASRALYAVCIALTCALAWDRNRRSLAIAFAAACAVVFYPLLRAVELNQSTLLVGALIGGSLLAARHGYEATSGALFALTAALKPQLALVVPMLFWQSRRFVAAGFATLAALGVISLAYAGFDNHVQYANVIRQVSRGYAFYPNQSWGALFLRVAGAPAFDFTLAEPSPSVRALSTLATVMTLAAGVWLLRDAKARAPDGRVDLSLAIALAWLIVTLASPISWEHHYVPAMFVFALLLARGAALSTRALVCAAVAFPLVAGFIDVRGFRGVVGHAAMSYVMLGGMLLAAGVVGALRSTTGAGSGAGSGSGSGSEVSQRASR